MIWADKHLPFGPIQIEYSTYSKKPMKEKSSHIGDGGTGADGRDFCLCRAEILSTNEVDVVFNNCVFHVEVLENGKK